MGELEYIIIDVDIKLSSDWLITKSKIVISVRVALDWPVTIIDSKIFSTSFKTIEHIFILVIRPNILTLCDKVCQCLLWILRVFPPITLTVTI